MSGDTDAQRVARMQAERVQLNQSIVDLVRDLGPTCCREVSEAFDLTRATASHLLLKLQAAGLIVSELEAATDYYPQMRWFRCPS